MPETFTGTPGVGLFGCGETVLVDFASDSFVVSNEEFVVGVEGDEAEGAGVGVGVGVAAPRACAGALAATATRCGTVCAEANAHTHRASAMRANRFMKD